MMNQILLRTAEHVSEGHPDKFCDQVADRILDEVLGLAEKLGGIETVRRTRTAIECLAKDNLHVCAKKKFYNSCDAGIRKSKLPKSSSSVLIRLINISKKSTES